MYYILNEDHVPVSVADIYLWEAWMQDNDNVRVARDVIDGADVSTVFLGIDHSFCENGFPILFETMVFGGEHNEYQERYSTWDQAVEGHQEVLRMLRPKRKEV